MIAEHWLWPYELADLDSFLEGYQGTGCSDHWLTSNLTHIAVYPLEEYKDHMLELERTVNVLQEDDPVVLMGDFCHVFDS